MSSRFLSTRRMPSVCLLVLPVVVFAAPVAGTLRLVPSQYPTIQAAINAAVNGDQVVVADGVYTGTGNKNLDFYGKAITVRSASANPALCIIDCQSSGRGFYFHTQEAPVARVEGFTIRNGSVNSGS